MTPNQHPTQSGTTQVDARWNQLQSEQHFRELTENTSDWIWEVDYQIRYVYASPKVFDLLGYTVEEVLGKTPFDFMPEEEATRLKAQVEDLVHNPQPFRALENLNLHKDGTLRVLETSWVPLFDEGGRFTGLRGIDRDITERKKVEDALQAALVRSAQEKARSEAIIAAIGEGLSIVDRDFKVLYQNQILKDLAGDALERHCYVVYGGREEVCEECPVARTLVDGRIHTIEKEALLGGKTVYREITASPLRDQTGKIVAGIELVRDITERKRAEHALKESEWQMKQVQRIAHLGSWQFDYEKDELVWSEETYRILGLDPKRARACYETFLEAVHPEDKDWVVELYRLSVRNRDGGYEIEHRIVRNPGGEIRHIHQKCEHMRNAAGRVIRSYGMIHDITPRKEAEERIRTLNADLSARAAELESVNKDLEAFSYTVSHDLRGPLTNINSYCQAIEELNGDQLDAQCAGFLRSVFHEIRSMDGLITSLLNLSRYNHVKLRNRRVDLSAIARTIAAELQLKDPQRQVTFRIADGLSAPGDEKLLGMVLVNLLNNAWKFSAHREETVISFTSAPVGGVTVYTVSDNGIGFDMSHSDRIFDVFQRLHRSDEFEGFGIGLTTVQRIIERHKGRIWAEGEPGKGARFSFTLHERESTPSSPCPSP